jgi:hypothetical protein
MQEYTQEIPAWKWTVQTTGNEMYRLSRQYSADVMPYIGLSLEEFHKFVASIPYRRDPDGEEYLSRPLAIFQDVGRGLDCDQKAIAIGAYCELRNIPYRYIAVGKFANKPLHHVLVIVQIGDKWLPMDATYPHSVPFVWMSNYEKRVVLQPPNA